MVHMSRGSLALSDDEFLSALERCELPASEFTHAAHVRAAYLYLSRGDFDSALARIRRSIRAYSAHLGKADRYDEAMTAAYLALIHGRMAPCAGVDGWEAFARANPDVLTRRL